jgi:hypothetical protein
MAPILQDTFAKTARYQSWDHHSWPVTKLSLAASITAAVTHCGRAARGENQDAARRHAPAFKVDYPQAVQKRKNTFTLLDLCNQS